jgi:Iodothyronine deiodinase
MEANREQSLVFEQPRELQERRRLARILPRRLKYRIPLAVDAMDDRVGTAYAAWPERIYVLARGGRILYKGEPGPFGFEPEKAKASLKALFGGR